MATTSALQTINRTFPEEGEEFLVLSGCSAEARQRKASLILAGEELGGTGRQEPSESAGNPDRRQDDCRGNAIFVSNCVLVSFKENARETGAPRRLAYAIKMLCDLAGKNANAETSSPRKCQFPIF